MIEPEVIEQVHELLNEGRISMSQARLLMGTRTLRDEFAMAALPGIITMWPKWDFDEHAMDAYKVADAMLRAREPREPTLEELHEIGFRDGKMPGKLNVLPESVPAE